jgi:hypothetical protein
MATFNPVTEVAAVVSAIDTVKAHCAAYVAFNTDATGAPVVNAGNAGLVNQVEVLLKALHQAEQFLNQTRFQSGAVLDSTITYS